MFNKETEYALRGLVYIQQKNQEGENPGVVEIAEEIDAPLYYTAKILQRLVRNGFIGSIKGKGGGFYFENDKPELLLKDIIINIEGGEILTRCGFGLKQCEAENPCALHDKYVPIRESINELVHSESIQSLAKNSSKRVI